MLQYITENLMKYVPFSGLFLFVKSNRFHQSINLKIYDQDYEECTNISFIHFHKVNTLEMIFFNLKLYNMDRTDFVSIYRHLIQQKYNRQRTRGFRCHEHNFSSQKWDLLDRVFGTA